MRQLSRSYLQHARRHLPEGSDPLLAGSYHVVWPTNPIILPIGGSGNSGPYATQDTTPPPDDWNTVIDSTRRNNLVLSYTGDGIGTLIWPITCGPGGYTFWLDTFFGTGYGIVTCYLAGAYDPVAVNSTLNGRPPSLSSSDWIELGSWDFGDVTFTPTYEPIFWTPQQIGANLSGGAITWTVVATDAGGEGVTNLYQKSTLISSGPGRQLDGGPGYFFFRVDVTNQFDISEAFISFNETLSLV